VRFKLVEGRLFVDITLEFYFKDDGMSIWRNDPYIIANKGGIELIALSEGPIL
jgi:hypothetical protein